MDIVYKALPTERVRRIQNGGVDDQGQLPERVISDGKGNPCRHCLAEIPEGQELLIVAYKPFDGVNPYTETGPLFLCGSECSRHPDSHELPALYTLREKMLIKGYSADERIVYGTGGVVNTQHIQTTAENIFTNSNVSYIHLRSEEANCFHFRIDRA